MTFSNGGTAPMTLGNIYIAGLNPGDFARTGGTCPSAFPATLAAGASCTVQVTFSPAALGARQARLAFANNAANMSYQVVALSGNGTDNSAPNVPGAVSRTLLLGKITSNLIPLRVNWVASTSPSVSANGVPLSYQLEQSNNGGTTYTPVTLSSPTATSYTTALVTGSYRFRVRACYGANCSAWSTSAVSTLSGVQESDKSVSYGGTVRYAGTNKDKVTYKFTTSSVAFVSTLGPNRGRANIVIDGITVATIDLYSATQQTGQIVYVVSGLTPVTPGASHQVVVQVLGTRNTLSTGTRVDIDGFITLP